MRIIFGDEVNKKYLHDCIDMDYESYRDDQHLDYQLVESFMIKNPYIYIMCIDEETDKAIAYINFSPVSDEIYEKMRNGLILDSEITPKDIMIYENNNCYSCYFYSIVVNEKYRNRGIARTLIENLKEFINRLKKQRNIEIVRIVGDVLSEGGEYVANALNMKYVCDSNHDSKIYEYVSDNKKYDNRKI